MAVDKEWAAAVHRALAAADAIMKVVGKQRGVQGNIPCPSCGKTLFYSVAKSNGHIHAQCETEGCTKFFQ